MSSKQKCHDADDDDDYIAKLLAEDAKKSSVRYASIGLSALLPKRPAKSAPKPNTRFLKHLVQEVDTHNTALKKKEELESRIRLRELRHADRDERNSYSKDEHRRKRRRISSSEPEDSRGHRSHRSSKRSRSPRRRDRLSRHQRSYRSEYADHHQQHDAERDGSAEDERESDRRYDHRRTRSRERRDQSKRSRHEDRDNKSGYRSHSDSHRRSSHRKDKRSGDPDQRTSTERVHSSELDSDPLEDLVGPLPPPPGKSAAVRVRGRGAHKVETSSSKMDARFLSSYDPAFENQFDSEPDEVDNDWDMALEALRDRTMWKRKQAERMRDAGWSETDIQKWEESAMDRSDLRETDISRVRWAREGEAREWDKGKKS